MKDEELEITKSMNELNMAQSNQHLYSRVSYTSLRSEDISLVPDDHVKEQRKLEKMFRDYNIILVFFLVNVVLQARRIAPTIVKFDLWLQGWVLFLINQIKKGKL